MCWGLKDDPAASTILHRQPSPPVVAQSHAPTSEPLSNHPILREEQEDPTSPVGTPRSASGIASDDFAPHEVDRLPPPPPSQRLVRPRLARRARLDDQGAELLALTVGEGLVGVPTHVLSDPHVALASVGSGGGASEDRKGG